MKLKCPNNCLIDSPLAKPKFSKDGVYFRKSDSKTIQRYKCSFCGKSFSRATFSLCYRQKKRRVNDLLFKLLSSGVSMRRAAIILNIHRITVKRKLDFLAMRAKKRHVLFLDILKKDKVEHLQIDDLITIEHTKLKPLSLFIAVDAKRRFILGIEVSKIPSFGLLAETSRKKYGFRRSEHKEGIWRLFSKIKGVIKENSLVRSDDHKNYPEFVKKFLPKADYRRFKSVRASLIGQGELKKIKRDPLFMINHTCAMLRANVNRLIRKTWCTTKDPLMLQKHLDVYIDFHNFVLIKK